MYPTAVHEHISRDAVERRARGFKIPSQMASSTVIQSF